MKLMFNLDHRISNFGQDSLFIVDNFAAIPHPLQLFTTFSTSLFILGWYNTFFGSVLSITTLRVYINTLSQNEYNFTSSLRFAPILFLFTFPVHRVLFISVSNLSFFTFRLMSFKVTGNSRNTFYITISISPSDLNAAPYLQMSPCVSVLVWIDHPHTLVSLTVNIPF